MPRQNGDAQVLAGAIIGALRHGVYFGGERGYQGRSSGYIARTRSLSQGQALNFERVEALKRVEALLRGHIFAEGLAQGKEIQAACPECGESITKFVMFLQVR